MKDKDLDLSNKNLKKEKDKLVFIDTSIQNLNTILNQISQFWKESQNLSKSAKELWISDAKEAYYQLNASYENLNACITSSDQKQQLNNAESSRHFLMGAESGMKQALSELKTLKDQKSKEIAEQWEQTFNECKTRIESILSNYLVKKELKPPESPVLQVNDEEYHLLCAICGTPGVIIKIGSKWYTQGRAVIYEGISKSTTLHINTAPEILTFLKQQKIKELHRYMIQNLAFEGMDAYCPECDKIYCRHHYITEEEWDEGFYDCTFGTCPLGHRRLIDD